MCNSPPVSYTVPAMLIILLPCLPRLTAFLNHLEDHYLQTCPLCPFSEELLIAARIDGTRWCLVRLFQNLLLLSPQVLDRLGRGGDGVIVMGKVPDDLLDFLYRNLLLLADDLTLTPTLERPAAVGLPARREYTD
jgi:hypothetical protein